MAGSTHPWVAAYLAAGQRADALLAPQSRILARCVSALGYLR
jgi:hypothetical protein